MNGIGTVIPGFAGLSVRIPGQNWNFLLRRTDYMPEPGFGAFHNAPVTARHTAVYLPNWAKLKWVRIPENILTRSESIAYDRPHQVNVLANFGGGLTHDDVVAAFLEFMAKAAD